MLKARGKGTVMLLLLTTIFIVLVLAGIVSWLILNQSRVNQHQIERARAYYAAMGGITIALEKIRGGDWVAGSTYQICRYTTDGAGGDSLANCQANCPNAAPYNNTCDYDIPYNVTIVITNINSTANFINATVNYTYATP